MALIAPRVHVSRAPQDYDGRQLRAHWLYETYGLEGDACAAFAGAADVHGGALVDLADRRQGLRIAARSMLHLLSESFGPDLDRAVFMQRLQVMLAVEHLRARGVLGLSRSGDDIFVGEGKLSVSIATVSPVSCLVHLGLNVTNEGTPVETAALADHGIEPFGFAEGLLSAYAAEIDRMARATWKVRSVP